MRTALFDGDPCLGDGRLEGHVRVDQDSRLDAQECDQLVIRGEHDARCDIRVGPCRLWKRLAEGEEGGHFEVCHGALALGVHHDHLLDDGVQLRGTKACWSFEGMWGRERVNVGWGGGEQHGEDHVVSVHEGDVMVT